MNKKISYLLLAALLGSGSLLAQTRVIAHRGYWNCEGSAQNSIAALHKAAEAGVYGSEFDVLITADGIPVVNHDDSIAGYAIESTAYGQLKNLKLKNGESLPTVEQYLQAAKQHPQLQLILEIKPHKRVVNEDRAVKEVLALVRKYEMEAQVEYISFSMNICKELHRQSPDAPVYYLRSDVTPQDLKALGLTGLDYYYKALKQYPEWIDQAKELGLKVNVWTVNESDDMQTFVTQGVDFITTDKPVDLKRLITSGSK